MDICDGTKLLNHRHHSVVLDTERLNVWSPDAKMGHKAGFVSSISKMIAQTQVCLAREAPPH